MMDESMRTFANMEISCPTMDSNNRSSRESSASLDLFMTRHKHPQHHDRDQEEASFVFPTNQAHKSCINSDDTLATCNTSMSTFHSVASGGSSCTAAAPATVTGPLHQYEPESSSVLTCSPYTPRHSPSLLEEEDDDDDDEDQYQQPPIAKRVQFVLDEGGDVLCSYLPSEGILTEEEKQAVWWTPLENKLFRRYCKKSAQLARNSEYAEHFTKVYDACSQKHITDVREHCHIARTHARGLEVVVFPTLVQARKLVVKGVVKTQEKLPATMDADQRAKVLSATSRCLTGRSRLLSRVFAVGDEEIAKDCYYSMNG